MAGASATCDHLKFTRARFEAVHADRPADPDARAELRTRWRGRWLPPALIPEEWRVVETFCYWTERPGVGEHYVVPAGFVFDGASTPWPLTILVPKTHPIYLAAAALHDHLYEAMWQTVPRPRADDIFLHALMVSGLNWVWAGLMWRAVRAGGWYFWWRRTDTAFGRFLARAGAFGIPVRIVGTLALGLGGMICDLCDLIVAQSIYRRYRRILATP